MSMYTQPCETVAEDWSVALEVLSLWRGMDWRVCTHTSPQQTEGRCRITSTSKEKRMEKDHPVHVVSRRATLT